MIARRLNLKGEPRRRSEETEPERVRPSCAVLRCYRCPCRLYQPQPGVTRLRGRPLGGCLSVATAKHGAARQFL